MRFFKVEVAAAAAYRKFCTEISAKPSNRYTKLKKDKTNERKQYKPRVKWTDEQNSILSAISQGSSVFITGSAGTGKTLFLKEVTMLNKKITI